MAFLSRQIPKARPATGSTEAQYCTIRYGSSASVSGLFTHRRDVQGFVEGQLQFVALVSDRDAEP